MILTLESSEQIFKPLESRPKNVQQLIKSQKCINCDQPLLDNQKIDYVDLDSGELRWWHTRINEGTTCVLENKGIL